MSRKFLTPIQLPADPTLALEATPKQYVDLVETEERSKGGGLVVNGTGLLGTNYNFSWSTFAPTDHPVGTVGGFLTPAGSATLYNDEYIPINPSNSYVLGCWARETNASAVGPTIYTGLAPYDASNNVIAPAMVAWQTNTTTTLAADLKPSDTTVQLTSAANWNNAAGASTWLRGIVAWNYTDALGYAWPIETYSRNYWFDLYADGGISGNTITLKVPWAGTLIPAGTSVSNSTSGSAFMYGAWSNNATPTTWTWRDNRTAPYTGVNVQTIPTTKFPQGCVKVKIILLPNRVTNSRTIIAGVVFEEYGHSHTFADTYGTLAQLNTAITDADVVPTTRTIATTAPLTGGGDLSANRTLDISTFTATVKGAVPPPTTATGKFLSDNGTWVTSNEVWIGATDPIATNPTIELWVDTST